jgi:hypothetical protein
LGVSELAEPNEWVLGLCFGSVWILVTIRRWNHTGSSSVSFCHQRVFLSLVVHLMRLTFESPEVAGEILIGPISTLNYLSILLVSLPLYIQSSQWKFSLSRSSNSCDSSLCIGKDPKSSPRKTHSTCKSGEWTTRSMFSITSRHPT